MIAELAAANAAFAVIKEALRNGGDLVAAGSKLGEYVGLKSKISKKANSKGNSSEEFWAIESLRKQEEELKQLLIYQGRAGLWDDWLKYQIKKKQEQDREIRENKRKIERRKQIIVDIITTILITLIGISGIGVFILMLIYILKERL